MAGKKCKSTELAVFKGREAKLNRAIFQTLALEGSQTIYDIHKRVRLSRGLRVTRYASVNKRIRVLEQMDFVTKCGKKQTKAGFEGVMYKITVRAYLALALFNSDFETTLMYINDSEATTILAAILTLQQKNRLR